MLSFGDLFYLHTCNISGVSTFISVLNSSSLFLQKIFLLHSHLIAAAAAEKLVFCLWLMLVASTAANLLCNRVADPFLQAVTIISYVLTWYPWEQSSSGLQIILPLLWIVVYWVSRGVWLVGSVHVWGWIQGRQQARGFRGGDFAAIVVWIFAG